MRLEKEFYHNEDVVQIAQDLLGKYLCSQIGGVKTVGKIVETEAYKAPEDKASHAYGNKLTARTKTMFEAGGVAYIYLCYGMHHLFNVVTAPKGIAHAVLIRAIEPMEGIETMLLRRNQPKISPKLCAGPATLSQAMGFTTALNGTSFIAENPLIWLEDGEKVAANDIMASPRVGVDYAAECALWDWRFRIKNSKWTGK